MQRLHNALLRTIVHTRVITHPIKAPRRWYSNVQTTDESFYKKRQIDIEKYEAQGGTLYRAPWHVTTSIHDFVKKWEPILAKGDRNTTEKHTISGRVLSKRQSSNKLYFYTIQDGSGKNNVQIMATEKDWVEPNFNQVNELIKRGDIIGVTGIAAKSGRGELSIIPETIEILAPCWHNIPHYTLSSLEDPETRYRNRSLDFIVNRNLQHVFITRSKIMNAFRTFFTERGYLEVETPILSALSGGAAAKPFHTHLHAMNMDLKLRIAPELYLKQLVIGGMERVFEIGRIFRNEGIDATHNPEFTSCESYEAYADYNDMMNMTEELMKFVCQQVIGSNIVTIDNIQIDFGKPFRRISYLSSIEQAIGQKLPDSKDPNCVSKLQQLCKNHHISIDMKAEYAKSYAYLIDKLLGALVEPNCIQPTFIIDYPIELSPLARNHRENSSLTERFELFVNGKELCNAYTELNDPREQRKRFVHQAKQKQGGDEEAHEMDETFCHALEYGLPPTGGWGCGMDRLVMMLTGQNNIRDVLLFPMMKPRDN
jgi:lysyl-tRNA synthetase class 2